MLPCLLIAIAAATQPATETLMVHGGPSLLLRIQKACALAPSMTHVVLAGNEVDMYAMQAYIRRQCPTVLAKTSMLQVYANHTADALACALQQQPLATGTWTQMSLASHMETVQRTTLMLAATAPSMRWLYVSLPDPAGEAVLFDPPGYPAADVAAALRGPCGQRSKKRKVLLD